MRTKSVKIWVCCFSPSVSFFFSRVSFLVFTLSNERVVFFSTALFFSFHPAERVCCFVKTRDVFWKTYIFRSQIYYRRKGVGAHSIWILYCYGGIFCIKLIYISSKFDEFMCKIDALLDKNDAFFLQI